MGVVHLLEVVQIHHQQGCGIVMAVHAERSTVETGPLLRNSGYAPQTGRKPAAARENRRQSPL
ncbi:MAG: hypothetical protein HZC06_01525 [Methylocystis sp.]|nr:hypothetical protein [Methylocystis sp.]